LSQHYLNKPTLQQHLPKKTILIKPRFLYADNVLNEIINLLFMGSFELGGREVFFETTQGN
jgi:hypothetical protein